MKNGQNIKMDILQKDIQIANKHMKKYSISLVDREMQIRATVRYTTSHPLGWLKLKRQTFQGFVRL